MKFVFICALYSRLDENYYKSINYCRYVLGKGCIPINTITMYHDVIDERVPDEYKAVIQANRELMKFCDEVWVFGKGAEMLIADAEAFGKPVIYIDDTFTKNNCSETLSVIMREYETNTGKGLNRCIMENIMYYLNAGLSDKLIIAAIKKTALKNAGWNYLEGILRNCLSRGITTEEEFLNKKGPEPKTEMATFNLELYEKMLNEQE